jgi:hypothetical protein
MVGTSSFLISSRVPLKPRARSILTEGSGLRTDLLTAAP